MINIMIMAGGKGERFWPKSRLKRPKQLLPITGEKSMIEETVDRVIPVSSFENIFISTNSLLDKEIKDILKDIPEDNYIVEPEPRDTAPAIAFATAVIDKKYPGSVMAVLPADHYIPDSKTFQEDLKIAGDISRETGCLITFGIKPVRIETGYGYIELGEVINSSFDNSAYEVKSFKEKPDFLTAKSYVEKGNFVWNSGMFVWTTTAIREAFEKYLPEAFEGILKIQEAMDKGNLKEELPEIFKKLPKISIDYGVMEKAENVLCMKARFGWDDVGSWPALERVYTPDENNNISKGLWVGEDTKNSIIWGDEENLIVTLGVSNLVVVKERDSILIMDKNKAQNLKKVVEKLKEDKNLKKFTE